LTKLRSGTIRGLPARSCIPCLSGIRKWNIRRTTPGTEAEARIAVGGIFGLDHLLNLEAGAKGMLAEGKREVVKVGASRLRSPYGSLPAPKPVVASASQCPACARRGRSQRHTRPSSRTSKRSRRPDCRQNRRSRLRVDGALRIGKLQFVDDLRRDAQVRLPTTFLAGVL